MNRSPPHNTSDLADTWEKQPTIQELTDQRHTLYLARLTHARNWMRKSNVPAMLVTDPNTIFYLTGARNMQLFGLRSPSRYLLCMQEGLTILFEYLGCEHLATDLPTVDQIIPAIGLNKLSSGDAAADNAQTLTQQLIGIFEDSNFPIDTLAIDRFPFQTIDALRSGGFTLTDADDVLIPARAVKLPIEIAYLKEAMTRVESAVERMENKVEPDMTESEAWAEFHFSFMAKEGQYISTRLFQSGSNTYPYFQEAGTRKLCEGDLLCLDTDALGYEGYAVDFSRTFVCGHSKPTDHQRYLYDQAREQLEHNASLLQPHIEFRELAGKAWAIPEQHQKSRYYCIGHGLGMAGEFPNIPHYDPQKEYPLAGYLEPGMVICLESYIGSETSGEGVKLEDQFLILEDRVERMSLYPFSETLGQ